MCQCKVICSNRTLSLMFGCKVSPMVAPATAPASGTLQNTFVKMCMNRMWTKAFFFFFARKSRVTPLTVRSYCLHLVWYGVVCSNRLPQLVPPQSCFSNCTDSPQLVQWSHYLQAPTVVHMPSGASLFTPHYVHITDLHIWPISIYTESKATPSIQWQPWNYAKCIFSLDASWEPSYITLNDWSITLSYSPHFIWYSGPAEAYYDTDLSHSLFALHQSKAKCIVGCDCDLEKCTLLLRAT